MIRRRTTPRRRAERSVAQTLAIALATTAVLAGVAWVAAVSPDGVPGFSYYTLTARFADLGGLQPHSDVRLAGERIGQVLDLRLTRDAATVQLQLSGSVAPLRSETRLVIRSQGLLGARYIEVIPGTRGPRLPSGATLPASQTAATVTVPVALTAFDPSTRRNLGLTLDGLGQGVLGRGLDLNQLIADSPTLFDGLSVTASAVLARAGAARRFAPSLHSAVAAADPAREQIADGFAPEAASLKPLGQQSSSVQQALDLAPSTLAATRTGLHQSAPLLANAERLARAARAALGPAPATLHETYLLLRDAPIPLARADALLQQVPSLVTPVVGLSGRLRPELARLSAALGYPIPALLDLGPRRCDILGWASNWRSMLGWGVAGGGAVGPLNVLRFELIEGPGNVQGVNLPNPLPMGSDPYPAPCAANAEVTR